MSPPDFDRGSVIRTPATPLPEAVDFTAVGRSTRRRFFPPQTILQPVVGAPQAVLQTNIRHRTQIAPYLDAFVDSAATDLILAISEDVQQSFGVCVEDAVYLAAELIDDLNRTRRPRRAAPKRVAFLFDHALTYEAAARALQAGVSGIMYDPSQGGRQAVSIEENIALSTRFVALAAQYEASVELEVGVIPGMEGAVETEFTDPAAVASLVHAFPDVAVAVSVGNEHYRLSPRGRGLQLGLLRRIRAAAPRTPLVLHGGTGVSDADLRSAITSCLLDKLNVGTEFMAQTLQAVAAAMGLKAPTNQQLRDPVYSRHLLYHLDVDPQRYGAVTHRAVYKAAATKLAFLTPE